MQIGVVFPQTEIGPEAGLPGLGDHLGALELAAEALTPLAG